jgi:hypothetical protein
MSDHNLPDDANADQGAQPTQAPQPLTPVPSVRLSIHTPPIPTRRTSITASEMGSFTLRSPFTFGGFGPSTLPDGNDPSLLWDETDVNFPPLPTVPPLRRDSEDSHAADFVGEDLTTDADYQPENLKTIHRQPVQPDVQAQADVPADVHDPAATDGAEFLEPAGQTATTPEQTIEEKIRTFHISDDQPSGQSQTAPPAQNPD